MANELDELNAPEMEQGRDASVIAKQIGVKLTGGEKFLEVLLWILLIIPGVIYYFKKVKAKQYFDQLQQKIQHDASQIDNYLEQRVTILQNCASLVNKAVALDKETFAEIAKYRSGNGLTMNEEAANVENMANKINVVMEKYPDLKAHKEIEDAMQQNSYLQKEITAARELYNDAVNTWNAKIFEFLAPKSVAAKNGYTTRIPFIASKEVKEKARGNFFE